MRKNKYTISWKDKVVGEMIEPTFEMFEIYGKWKPFNTSTVTDFIEEIKKKGESIVRIGTTEPPYLGIVEFVPDNEIQVKSYPNMFNESK